MELPEWATPLPAGTVRQTGATLEAMRRIARASAMRQPVQRAAARIAAGIDGHNRAAMIWPLRRWLEAHTLFLPDPLVPETELIRAPDFLLEQVARDGQARGDCDDVATLAAALALALGLRARFRALAWGGQFAHVFTEVAAPGSSTWTPLDVTEPTPRHDATSAMIVEA